MAGRSAGRVGSLRRDAASPIAIVLSGGGARGAFQVGAWKVLSTHPAGLREPPDVVSGTSCGAINGALIAAGLTADEILEVWLGMADRPPIVANEAFFDGLREVLADLLWSEPVRGLDARRREGRILLDLIARHRLWRRGGPAALALTFLLTARYDTVSRLLGRIPSPFVFDANGIKEHLRRAIGSTELRQTRTRLAINTVNVRTGRVVRIVNHPPEKSSRASVKHYRYEPVITLDMILASASIPLLFNPVAVGDLVLWDGGLLVNSPLAPAVALGARRLVPILVTAKDPGDTRPLATFGDAMERAADTFLENAYTNDRKLLLDRNALALQQCFDELNIVELFRAIRPQSSQLFDAGSYLYFERRAMLAMFEAGKRAATEWLELGPQVDSRELSD